MIPSKYRFSLDVHEPHSSVCLDVKREETNSRTLLISLTEGGYPYRISEECYAVFSATKPDGNAVLNPCVIDDDTIIYELTPQTTAAVGLMNCEIRLYGADDALLISPGFLINVNETEYEEGDEVESETEVNALTHLISEATTAVHESKEATQEAKALVNTMNAEREELEDNIAETRDYAQSARVSAQGAANHMQQAAKSEINASHSATGASAAAQAAQSAQAAAADSEAKAKQSSEEAVTSAGEARASAEEAKTHAESIDPELLNARINGKADNLFFDPATNLLYLMSNDQIIGDGIQVATSGGGGSGTLSYAITLKNLLDSRVITVAEGTKVELRFSYASQDEEGIDDGPGIGKVIVGTATKQTFTAVQGDNTVEVTSYLTSGSNTVKVQVENSEGAKKTLTYTITVAAAHLTSPFDVSTPFSGEITFPYVPTGIAEKTVHFEVDGAEIGTATVTASGRQQSYTIPAQKHGAHTLRAWFECTIDGHVVTSNVLTFQMICIEEGNTSKIISVDFSQLSSAEQFANIVTKYRVYDPGSLTSAITLEANGEVIANLTVDRTEQTWTYRPMNVGELTQTIRCGDVSATWERTITESSIQVEAETEALALHLSSYGRSNNEENPGVWESGNVKCVFQDFNFVSDGWVQDEEDNTVLRVSGDARLKIPYKIFAYDFRTTGKTIEFEMATRDVLNYDAEVINCFNSDRGFSITAQQLHLASEQSELGTRYKEDEHLRVTFVVEKKSENRLILCYINGIMSGAAQYPDGDDFSQADPVGITIGSNDCTTDLYNIRMYDNSLTRFQVLDNWIADTQNVDERLARYLRNKIFDAYGRVVISQLPKNLCYLVLQCAELPQFKGDKKTCSGYFVDLVHPERSFTFTNAQIDVQGTSSQYYWRKNYKIKFKNGFILSDGSSVTVYAMNEDAVPTGTYTMKADVASSEGYYNVDSAKLFNKYHPFKMPAQEADPRVRYSIDGFPIVIFWDNGKDTEFLGKYNFNHDKGTSEPFGLAPGDERWEVLQNGTDRVGFHSAEFSGDGWKEDFEGNFPDGNTDLTNLKPMCEWVTSTKEDPAKFDAELAAHFVESAVIYYYVFTEAFLCMDQREKNVLWRYIQPLQRWLADYYDADSIIGHNNQAQPVFEYWMEDIDYTASGDPVFNGQNSVFWQNLRATRADAIKAEWHRLRDAGFSYESVMAEFEAHKSVWPEAIYNEDMQTKCLEALIQKGDGTYLPFLRGDKWAWTQWFMYNRFRYLDSKYEYGSSVENRATIRTNVMANLWLTYYIKMYGHAYYNAEHIVQRVEKDTAYEFVSHASGAEDRVIGLNDADMITSLGDLAPHMVELIDLSKMVRLQELKLGDGAEGYVNNALTSVTFGNNILLRKVDLRNCVALTQALDLSGCTNIEEAYFDGTSVTAVGLPNGGVLKKLHLPETVTNLTVLNQKALTEFVIPSYANVSTVRLENNSSVIAPLAILAEIPANSRVRIIGFVIEDTTAAEVISLCDRLDTMRGLDENGNNVDKPQVSGTVYIDSLTGEELYRIQNRYPDIKVVYNKLVLYTVRFWNGDTLFHTVDNVAYMADVGLLDETPVKVGETDWSRWVFNGWRPAPSAVTGDMDCYAQYKFAGSYARELVQKSIEGDYENDSVEIVGANVFREIRQLTSVTFKNAKTLCSHAFFGMKKLKKADFHSVTELNKDTEMFAKCDSLEAIIFRSESVPSIIPGYSYVSAFRTVESGQTFIYVPKSLVEDYKAATHWSIYGDQIRAIEDYPEICGGDA